MLKSGSDRARERLDQHQRKEVRRQLSKPIGEYSSPRIVRIASVLSQTSEPPLINVDGLPWLARIQSKVREKPNGATARYPCEELDVHDVIGLSHQWLQREWIDRFGPIPESLRCRR